MSDGRFEQGDEAADRADRAGHETGEVAEIPVIAGNVRWERPTMRSFWNALADPEREALAAAGVEQIFRAGSVLCRAGDESSQVMIIDSGWVKISVKVNARAEAREARSPAPRIDTPVDTRVSVLSTTSVRIAPRPVSASWP